MSNQNNTPTDPGWYWVRPWGSTGLEIAYVSSSMSVSFNDNEGSYPLNSNNLDGSPAFDWLGPVPMPGEWAPMDLFNQLWTELSKTSPTRGSSAADILHRARAWDDPEAAP